jgi:hypothetical protein
MSLALIITPGPDHVPGIYPQRLRLLPAMNDKERSATTQLPPPPDVASDIAAAASTIPPADGSPPSDLPPDSEATAPESDPTLRAEAGRYASPELERLSIQRLLDLNTRVEGYMVELLDPKGSFAQSRVQMVTDLSLVFDNAVAKLKAAFESRFTGIEEKISNQGRVIYALEVALKEHKAASDAKFAELEAKIAQLKGDRGAGEAAAAASG